MTELEGKARRRLVERDLRRIRDAHAYGVVLALVVVLFLFADAAPSAPWTASVIILLQGVTLAAALATSSRRRIRVRAREVVVGAAALAGLQLVLDHTRVVNSTVAILSAALAVTTAVVVARGVARQNEVNVASVCGAVAIYLLVGMMFVFVYAGVQVIGGHDFFAQGVAGTRSLFLYFSYVTMLTLGYGDYTPATQVGKTFAVVEALLGQLYLVTVVAVLVGSFGRRRDKAWTDG